MKITTNSTTDNSLLNVKKVIDMPSNTLYESIGGCYNGHIFIRKPSSARLISIFPLVQHQDEDNILSGVFRKLPSGFVVKIEQE